MLPKPEGLRLFMGMGVTLVMLLASSSTPMSWATLPPL